MSLLLMFMLSLLLLLSINFYCRYLSGAVFYVVDVPKLTDSLTPGF